MALADGQFIKSAEHQALAPLGVPLCGAQIEGLTAMLQEAANSRANFDYGGAPPDARASGWLLVLQTALPVRGPSLV